MRYPSARALILVGVAFAVHTALQSGFLSDDTLISLRYADRFLHGHGLTFTDGERVEGYTNPLFVLLCAGLGKLGCDLVFAARALSFVGGAAIVMLASRGLFAVNRSDTIPASRGRAPLLVGLLAAAFAPIAVWSVAGLEQTMLGALACGLILIAPHILTASGRTLVHAAFGASVLFVSSVWLRADGVVVCAGVLFGLFVASLNIGAPRRINALRVVALSVVVGAALAVQLAIRWGYYHALVPNTALAKVAWTRARIVQGARYILEGSGTGIVVVALGVGGILALVRGDAQQRTIAICAASTVATWATYVALVGGDIFPAYRQLVPAFAVLALVAASGLESLLERTSRWRVGPVVVLLFTAHAAVQLMAPEVRRAAMERWEWDGFWVGRALADIGAGARPLLAVDAAGVVPYVSRLPTLDMLGLTDRYLATHPPPSFGDGTGLIGHELGDGGYVLSRRPDIVLFCGTVGSEHPCFRGGFEMLADVSFRERYHLVRLESARGPRHVATFFVRDDGALGSRWSSTRWVVPAIQLRGSPLSRWRVDGRGVVSFVSGPHRYGEMVARLEPGTYRVLLDPPTPHAVFAFECDGVSTSAVGARTVEVQSDSLVRVRFTTLADDDILIQTAALERIEGSADARCVAPTALRSIRESELPSSPDPRLSLQGFADVSLRGLGLEVVLDPPRPIDSVRFTSDQRGGLVVEAIGEHGMVAWRDVSLLTSDPSSEHRRVEFGVSALDTAITKVRIRTLQSDDRSAIRDLVVGP